MFEYSQSTGNPIYFQIESKNKREKKKKVNNDVLAYKTPEKKDPYMKFKDIPISEDETKKNFMRVLFNNFHNK